MSARRDSALQVVEVIDEIDDRWLSEWILYGKSAGGEVKVALCIRASCATHDEIVVLTTRNGLGLYVVENGATVEMVEARDLSATTTVPGLGNEDQWVREALGRAVEEYERTNWQEGLRRATTGFEELCRARLIQLLGQGARFAPVPRRKTPPTVEQIQRAPLGRLCIFFSMHDMSTAESSTIVEVIGERWRTHVTTFLIRTTRLNTVAGSEVVLRDLAGRAGTPPVTTQRLALLDLRNASLKR